MTGVPDAEAPLNLTEWVELEDELRRHGPRIALALLRLESLEDLPLPHVTTLLEALSDATPPGIPPPCAVCLVGIAAAADGYEAYSPECVPGMTQPRPAVTLASGTATCRDHVTLAARWAGS